jgi:hypothetical protein
LAPWCPSFVYEARFVSFSPPGLSLQGIGGSKLGQVVYAHLLTSWIQPKK